MAEISEGFVNRVKGIRFASGKDIDQFFVNEEGARFIDWFNARHAFSGFWDNRNIAGASQSKLQKEFETFWDAFCKSMGGEITFFQFIAVMGITINEIFGFLISHTEKYGFAGHPKIAYLFDSIPGVKQSYNKAPNETAFALFNNQDFLSAHKTLPLANLLANTNDQRWKGEVYPVGDFPVSGDVQISGIILQTDFFKYRGRGVIQTTWRGNYKRVIDFIKSYQGPSPVLKGFQSKWKNKDTELVASTSTADDWDQIFDEPSKEMVCEAIKIHSANAGNYLNLADTAAKLNAEPASGGDWQATKGSIFYVGKRVSGSSSYGRKFKNRIAQLCADLDD